MPTTLQQEYDLVNSATYQVLHQKAEAALVQAAEDIMNEASTVAHHDIRIRWAQAVRRNPQLSLLQAKIDLALNSIVADAEILTPGTASDDDIQFVINSGVPRYVLSLLI